MKFKALDCVRLKWGKTKQPVGVIRGFRYMASERWAIVEYPSGGRRLIPESQLKPVFDTIKVAWCGIMFLIIVTMIGLVIKLSLSGNASQGASSSLLQNVDRL
jgi:hypothetical protein